MDVSLSGELPSSSNNVSQHTLCLSNFPPQSGGSCVFVLTVNWFYLTVAVIVVMAVTSLNVVLSAVRFKKESAIPS